MRTKKLFVLIVPAVVLTFGLAWASHRLTPEAAPVARGAAYAQIRNCIDCHGDPESALADANYQECSNVNKISGHPEYDVNCTDVMAYFEAVRLGRNFEDRAHASSNNPLIAGERLARTYHCFQCHGDMGQGGFNNSGSFKGYVPGYFGSDFRILTRNADPDSVREWIMHGVDPKILEQPLTGQIATLIFKRQAVNMPSYKSLPPKDIEILVNYVIALNQIGPMTAKTVRLYGEQSRADYERLDFAISMHDK